MSFIAEGGIELLALEEQLSITEETIGLLKESTITMEDLMEAGLLTGAAVEQSKALLYETELSLASLKIKYTIRKIQFVC